MKEWLKEPRGDPWQLGRDAASTIVPNLNVCGWYDHCNGSIDLHRTIAAKGGSFSAKRHSRLIVGPWSHGGLGQRKQAELDFGPAADVDIGKLYTDWFGHWLRGDKNDVERWAPVRVCVTEFKNKRVQIFDTDGNSLSTIAVPSEPGGIAVDKEGRI